MAKGLCYYYDQPFERGHKCAKKTTQLFLVQVLGEEEKENTDEEFSGEVEFNLEDVEPKVSVNAMNGVSRFHTMGINGYVGKKTLHILLDSGSTQSFLDVEMERKLGCQLEPIAMQSVTIADGNQL